MAGTGEQCNILSHARTFIFMRRVNGRMFVVSRRYGKIPEHRGNAFVRDTDRDLILTDLHSAIIAAMAITLR